MPTASRETDSSSARSPKGQLTRQKILRAATRVVARRGIEHASVTEISRTARTSRSLLPYYLPRQDELLITLIRFIAEEGYTYFTAAAATTPRRSRKLPAGVEHRLRLNWAFFRAHPHYFQCFMLFYFRCTYDPDCRALNTRIVETGTDAFLAALREAFPRQETAGLRAKAESLYFVMYSSIQRSFILGPGVGGENVKAGSELDREGEAQLIRQAELVLA